METESESRQAPGGRREPKFVDGVYVYVDNDNRGKNRAKQTAGLFIFIGIFFGSITYAAFLVYQIMFKKSIKAFYILLMSLCHSVSIAGPSKCAQKLFEYIEPMNWFDQFKIIAEEKIDRKKVLFSWMPHAILCFPASFCRYDPNSPFYKSYLAGSRFIAKFIPFLSTVLQWNSTTAVNPENFKELLAEKKNISFVPGGFEEATITSDKDYRLWQTDRKGFIKYGLQYGYKVHPVFVFKETKGYKTSDFGLDFRIWLNKFKIPGVIFFSKFGIIPDNKIDVTIVIGKAISLPHIDKPTRAEVTYYHDMYLKEVKRLFDRHVEKCDPGAKLYLWGQQNHPSPKL